MIIDSMNGMEKSIIKDYKEYIQDKVKEYETPGYPGIVLKKTQKNHTS